MHSFRNGVIAAGLLIFGVLAAGCGPADSLFSLYTAEDKTFDPALLGAWKPQHPTEDSNEKNTRWVFKRKDANVYAFCWTAVNQEGCMRANARLVKLGDALFVDFEGATDDEDLPPKTTSSPFPIVPTHMFGRIWIEKDTLRIHLLQEDWIKKQIKAGTFKLPYLEVNGSILLSAKTEDLRQFAQQHAEDQDAFSEKFEFKPVE